MGIMATAAPKGKSFRHNLCDLVYQTPTKTYQRHIPVAFGIPDHVTYQTPTRHALLGSGRPPKTKLRLQAHILFCSLAVLALRVGHTIDVLSLSLSSVILVDFHSESWPRLDVVCPTTYVYEKGYTQGRSY